MGSKGGRFQVLVGCVAQKNIDKQAKKQARLDFVVAWVFCNVMKKHGE